MKHYFLLSMAIIFVSFPVFTPFCFAADSTAKPAKVGKAMYEEMISNPPIVLNERYDLLPVCPKPISNCPDANGKGGNSNTCPDHCTVTRTPGAVESSTGFVQGQSVSAICPAGYEMVGKYNAQNELIYKANPPMIFPITGMGAYYTYKSSGHDCGPYSWTYTSDDYCGGKYVDGEYTDTMNNASGYVVRVINSYRSSRCSCKGSCLICSCKVVSDPRWIYRYQLVQCTPPPGLHMTGNKVPISIVCARSKLQWKARP